MVAIDLDDESRLDYPANRQACKAMMASAGFTSVEQLGRFSLEAWAEWSVRHVAVRARL